MKRIVAAFCAFLASTSLAQAAGTALSALSAGAAVSGTDLFYNVQTVGAGGVKTTAAQLATFMWASPTFTGTVAGAGTIPLSVLATQATNTITGNATSGTASPTALAIGSCSATGSALLWTTNTGFGCATGYAPLASPTFSGTVTFAGGTQIDSAGNYVAIAQTIMDVGAFAFRVKGGLGVGPNSGSTTGFGWSSSDSNTSPDTTLCRQAAGVLWVGTTACNGSGTIRAANAIFTGLANSATTSAVCYNTGTGAITYDGTIGTCTVSALWHKNLLGTLNGDLDDPLSMLRPIVYTYKQNGDGIGDGRIHVGLAADDVAMMDARCVVYDQQGRLSNYEDRCILAYLVQDRAKLQKELNALKAAILR